mgnify:CR=1 FL=1
MHTHHHEHGHQHGGTPERRLRLALLFTLGFAGVEAAGGLWSGSLALLGDAGHMLTDSFALGLAALASVVARRPPSDRHSYGLGRIEVVAALFNGVLMLGVVAGITAEAVQRLESPQPVMGGAVMTVAAIGLGVNLGVAALLHGGQDNINVRGALLHVLGDLLGSVAALTAGAVIYFSGWTPIDPILAVVVCVLILYSTVQLLRDSLHVVMEGVPPELDLPEIGRAMAEQEHVSEVHDLHIWTLSSGQVALSAHIMLRDMTRWEQVLPALTRMLESRFGVGHVTLQPETNVQVLHPFVSRSGTGPD